MKQRTETSTDVCVIGAGPAGSSLAIRLAQLGHRVTLIERQPFPRRQLGESLSPGVLPLLDSIGAAEAAMLAKHNAVHRVDVRWGANQTAREDSRGMGHVVDRGDFDLALATRAVALGATLIQPGRVRTQHLVDGLWQLSIETPTGRLELSAAFLVDATGRSASSSRIQATGARTLALFGYWQGPRLNSVPCIESDVDAWRWGVPLPEGCRNMLIFVDAKVTRQLAGRSISHWYRERLMQCNWIPGNATLVSPVRAADATPYLAKKVITRNSIKVGDAACAIDPLSSSGVQKAIQSALAGAIVVNTLLRRPESAELARDFFQGHLVKGYDKHAQWAGGHYADAETHYQGDFWKARSRALESKTVIPPPSSELGPDTQVSLAKDILLRDHPCLVNDFVESRSAVCHPSLEEPVVFVGGIELASVLSRISRPTTAGQVASSLTDKIPAARAASLTAWMFRQGLLVTPSETDGSKHSFRVAS